MATLPTQEDATNVRVNEAKERLCLSAVKLFSKKGYSAASIREIIEDAGVTRPVLYYYFKNKEDLFTFLVESQFEEMCADLDEIIALDCSFEERLRAMAQGAFRRSHRSPEMVRMLMYFFFSPPITGLNIDKEELAARRFERIVRIIRMGIDDGELRSEDPEQLAFYFSGLMDMPVMANLDNSDEALTDEMADSLVTFFLRGAS